MAKKQNEKTKAVAIRADNYPIMGSAAGEAIQLIKENLGDEKLSPLDLARIRVPAGGVTVWTIPTVEGETHVEEFVGIVLKTKTTRQMWYAPFGEGEKSPPDCVSEDAMRGIGDPGGPCLSCKYNQFGSIRLQKGKEADTSKKKLCQEKRMIYTILEGQILPHVVVAPAMSLKTSRKYLVGMTSGLNRLHSVYTRFTLEKGTNPQGIDYCKILMNKVGDVEHKDETAAYAQAITPYLSIDVEDLRTATELRDEAGVDEEFNEEAV
jgi:hypothetical protein